MDRTYFWLGGSTLALAAGLSLAPAPAEAACVLTGSTVTCDGIDDDGFSGGNNLTLNALSGSFVQSVYDGNPSTFCPAFRAAIRLGTNARISNAGQILGRGNCGLGIDAGSGLILTNTGDIRTDSEVAYAILATSNFDVTNRGTIRTANAGSVAFVGGSNGQFTNAAGASMSTSAADAVAIVVEDSNLVTNNGTIRTTGSGSSGIDAGRNNTITNTGTITTTGVASSGVRVRGTGNIITNSGTITAIPNQTPRDGEDSIGILAENDRNTIINTGTISGDYAGVELIGIGNSLTNSGSISARAPSSATVLGGAVVVGGGGTATIINNQNSTILGVATAAIRVRSDTFLTLTNSGNIIGEIILGDAGSNLRFIGGTVTAPIRGSATGIDALVLEGNGTLTQPLLNFDRVEKRGTGQWTFTSSAGPLEVAGPVNIREGRLQVGTIRTTSLSVDRAAQLTGPITITGPRTGTTFANTNVVFDGTIYPGDGGSPNQEVMTIQGNLTLGATSQIESRLSATFGDLLRTTGNITIAGGGLNVKNGITPPRDGQSYVVITGSELRNTAGALCAGTLSDSGASSGTPCLARLTDPWPTFIRSTATVTGTAVTVTLQRLPYASVVTAPEAIAVASYLDQARVSVGGLFGLIPILDQMTEATARDYFTTYSSDVVVSPMTWNVLSGDALAAAAAPWLDLDPAEAPKGDWRIWGTMTARTGEAAPLLDAGHFDYDAKGVVAGLDVAVNDGTRVGVMAAQVDGETYFTTGNARADLESSSIGVYIAHAQSNWRMSLGLLLGDGAARMTRQRSNFNATISTITSSTDTSTDIGFAQTSYVQSYGDWSVSPTLRLTHVNSQAKAFRESGGMDIGAQDTSSWRGDAGVSTAYDAGDVHVSIGAFWSQNFSDNDRTATADEFRQPGSAFVIGGQAEKRGWLKTQAAASMDLTPALTAKLAWTGILNDRLGGHAATAGLSYRW